MEDALQQWHVADHGHECDAEESGGDQAGIAEQPRPEHAFALGAHGQGVEELADHDACLDQGDGLPVHRVLGGEVGERYAGAADVPEEHRTHAHGLDASEEEDPAHHRGREEAFAARAWRPVHHVGLRWLGAERQGRQDVRAQVDREHLDRGDRDKGESGEGGGEDGREFPDVVAEEVDKEFADVLIDGSSQAYGHGDGLEGVVQQHHLGGLARHVGA